MRRTATIMNSEKMKKANKLHLLNLIRKQEISRAELSRRTGLTRAAVTLIIDKLIEDDVVFESSVGETGLGRKPIFLDINEDRYYAMGLDISRDCCHLGMMNVKGRIIEKEEIFIEKTRNAFEALEIISSKVDHMLKTTKAKGELLGLGISTPGPIDISTGTILNPPNFAKWRNVRIVEHLKKRFKFNIFLDNNAIAQTLAEKNFGLGNSYHNYLVIMVNAGIGAGIIINDQLHRGVNGFGNELGHITVDINGEQCECGNIGCLELYAGLAAVVSRSKVLGLTSWKEIVDQALNGDPKCIGIVEQEANYLSTVIVACLNVLELEAVIIKGNIGYRPEMLLERINEKVQKRTITRSFREKAHIHVVPTMEDHEIVAAATLLIEKLFSGDLF